MLTILITNSIDVTFEADKINAMFQNGLDVLHIRKSNYNTEKLRKYINKIDKKFHNKIMIHDSFELLEEFDLRGIHVGREYRNRFWFRHITLHRLKKKFAHISISYSAEYVNQLSKLKKYFPDYVLFGRVFSDNTQNRLNVQFTSDVLDHVIQNSGYPIVALGGLDLRTTYKAMQLGFHGVALQSYIWNSTNPVHAFAEIKNIIDGIDLVRIANGS